VLLVLSVSVVSVAVLSVRSTAATPPVARPAAELSVRSRREPPLSGMDAIQHFKNNLAAYLALRQRVSAAVPNLTVSPDPTRLQRTVDELAARIRAARQHARRGEIFTDDVGRLFRSRIRQALDGRGISPAELLASIRQDTSWTPGRDLVVNRHFQWNSGWPELLEVLPVLPEALEYRLVHRDLLLVDVGADLVVDVLPHAIQQR
jgi:hypothetical protein